MQYSIVTRSSLLAREQTALFVEAFSQCFPDVALSIQPVQTKGDHAVGPIYNLKKAFVGELEQTLLHGSAHIAVHSLKDMSVFYQEGLCIAAVLPRGRVNDVLVSHRFSSLASLPDGAKIGTCSARRAAQLRHFNSSLRVISCRGNVQTRLEKLDAGCYDAIILAGVGLDRLGIVDNAQRSIVPLALDDFVPAGGQGAIAVQARTDQSELLVQIAQINHMPTYRAVMLERDIIRRFGGNCSTPLGVHVATQSDGFLVSIFLGDVFGRHAIKKTVFWPFQKIGYGAKVDHLVETVCQMGGREILDNYQRDLQDVFEH